MIIRRTTLYLLAAAICMIGTATAAPAPSHPLSQITPTDTNLNFSDNPNAVGYNITGLPYIIPRGPSLGIAGDLDLQGNDLDGINDIRSPDEITNYFASECSSGEAVTQIHPNGSYTCVDISAVSGTDDQTLREVLEQGNFAGPNDIYMNNSNILDIGVISVNTALSDGNISNSITISSSGSVNPDALTRSLNDGEVSDSISIGSSGSVNTGALNGVITNDIRTGFFTTSDPLTAGNLSNDSVTTRIIADGNVTAGKISSVDWVDLQNYPAACNAGEAVQVIGDTLQCVSLSANGEVSGTGAPGQVAFFETASNITGDPNFVFNTTNEYFGIGQTIPQYTLDVGGNASIAGTLYMNNNDIGGVDTLNATTINLGGTSLDDTYVNEAGDTMSGNLALGSNNITNVRLLQLVASGTIDANGGSLENVASIDNGGSSITVSDDLAVGSNVVSGNSGQLDLDATSGTDLVANGGGLLRLINNGNVGLVVNTDGSLELRGSVDAYGNSITNVSAISVSQPLTDGNISNTLTLDSFSSVDAGAIDSGTLSTDRYSAYQDLLNENYLDNDAAADLLNRSSLDIRFVNTAGDTMTGDLNLSGNDITDVGSLDVKTISFEIPLSDGNISDSITIGAGGSVDPAALSRALNDSEVENTLTIDNTGSVDSQALSGTITEDINAFVSVTDPLSDGNISDAITISDAGSVNSSAIEDRIAGSGLLYSNGVLSVDDGAGSGLDADTLDGREGDYYRQNLSQVLVEGNIANTSINMDGNNIALNGGRISGDGDDEGVSVDAQGRVGINNNNPQSDLDVDGSANVSSSGTNMEVRNNGDVVITLGS